MTTESELESVSDPYSIFLYGMNSPITRDRYSTRLRRFFSFIGLEGSIEEQCRTFVRSSKKDIDWAFRNIVTFLYSQKRRVDMKEITGSTVRNYLKAIKLFAEMNDIFISWKKITRGLPKGRKWADDRAPTIEEIRKITEYPDRRIKPIVSTMISSGIRLGAWDYLRWGHIKPIIQEDEVVAAKIVVYAGEEDEYFSFISPEAYTALKCWIDFRMNAGEMITEDSWMMRNLWDNRVTKGKGWVTIPKKLRSSGVKALVENAIWTQGLRKKLPPGRRRHEFQADHGFRKFFKTHAEQVMKPINVEILLSHSTGISDSYYRPLPKDLLEDYLKAVPLITVHGDTIALQKQVKELTEKSNDNDYIIKGKLQEKDKQIDVLIKKQEQFEQILQSLIDSGQLKPTNHIQK